jgi:Circadian oscillating protein COP23
MKNNLLFALVGISSIFSLSIINADRPSFAEGTTFSCVKSKQGVPTTFMNKTNGKKIPIVRWVANGAFPPPYTPLTRCQIVSRNFQRNSDQGNLKNIKDGIVNKYPVICGTSNSYDKCNKYNLLFTLKPGSNPKAVAAQLFDSGGFANGRILDESGGDELNIDFEEFLNGVEAEE